MDTNNLPLIGGIAIEGILHKEVEMREMTGIEEDILADIRKAQDGSGDLVKSGSDRMTDVLSRCTLRIGSVTPPDDGKPHHNFFYDAWEKAFAGDRGLATVFLRRLSLGDKYVFPMVCSNCNFKIERVSHDLSELPQREFFQGEDGTFDRDTPLLEGGGVFVTPKGKKIKYKFLRGSDEETLSKLSDTRPDALVTALIYSHVVAIDGEPAKWGDITALPSRERSFIRDKINKMTGGLDMMVEVTCPKCNHHAREKMGVGDPSFFFPSET